MKCMSINNVLKRKGRGFQKAGRRGLWGDYLALKGSNHRKTENESSVAWMVAAFMNGMVVRDGGLNLMESGICGLE